MTTRRALALAVMALDHVASSDVDVTDWARAAGEVRSLLSQLRPDPGGWFVAPCERDTRGRRG